MIHQKIQNLDRQMLDAVQNFLSQESSPALLRSLYESKSVNLLALWQQMCHLGLPFVAVAQEQGGLGLGLSAKIQLAKEAGKHLLPLPLCVAALAAPALLTQKKHFAKTEQELIEKVYYSGEAVLHLALPWGESQWRIDYTHIPGPVLFVGNDNFSLNLLEFNQKKQSIDKSIYYAILKKEQFGEGCRVPNMSSRKRILFMQKLQLIWAAKLCGVTEQALSLAIEYAKEREQFGRVIGANQAVKHRFADLWMLLDNSQLAIEQAAKSVSEELQSCQTEVNMAQYLIVHASKQITSYAIQVHGAMGITWECNIHMYLKRSRYLCALLNKHMPEGKLLQSIWQDERLMST